MSGPIMNFDDIAMPGTRNIGAGAGDKPKTKYWINVGLVRNGKLVSLPMGIPLDNLKARDIPSPKTQNQDFRNLRLAEKALWEKISSRMLTLKPGEEIELPLTVKLRMVENNELLDEELVSPENPFAIGDVDF